jgi:hypothetical protein
MFSIHHDRSLKTSCFSSIKSIFIRKCIDVINLRSAGAHIFGLLLGALVFLRSEVHFPAPREFAPRATCGLSSFETGPARRTYYLPARKLI